MAQNGRSTPTNDMETKKKKKEMEKRELGVGDTESKAGKEEKKTKGKVP